MNVRQETLTPERAKRYLRLNTSNRKMSDKTVREYARKMLNGQWVQNGDPIRIDKNNTILDGQHRLQAIVLSGKPQKYIIIEGLDPEAFSTIDVGKKRSLADSLSRMGYSFCNQLSFALRLVYGYETSASEDFMEMNQAKASRKEAFSIYLNFLENNPDLLDSVHFVSKRARGKRLFGDGLLTAMHYIFSKKNKSMANEFISGLICGTNLPENSPIIYIREKMIKNKIAGIVVSLRIRVMMIIKAWNSFRLNQYPKNLNLLESSKMPKVI